MLAEIMVYEMFLLLVGGQATAGRRRRRRRRKRRVWNVFVALLLFETALVGGLAIVVCETQTETDGSTWVSMGLWMKCGGTGIRMRMYL